MTCQDAREQLVWYLDGGLEASQRGELETHLKACVLCAKKLNTFHKLDKVLQRFNTIEPPQHVLTGIKEKLAMTRRPQRQMVLEPNRMLRYGLAVAAAVTLILLVSVPLYVKPIARNQLGQRMTWETDPRPAIHLQWLVADRAEATTTLRDWLVQIPEATLMASVHETERPWRSYLSRDTTGQDKPTPADADRFIVQLPASLCPALLAELAKHGKLSSQPPAPDSTSTDQPLTVELSLVVQAQ